MNSDCNKSLVAMELLTEGALPSTLNTINKRAVLSFCLFSCLRIETEVQQLLCLFTHKLVLFGLVWQDFYAKG